MRNTYTDSDSEGNSQPTAIERSTNALSAVAARNRQVSVGGFSPSQIGKDVAISSSLQDQLDKGRFKNVLAQDLSFDATRAGKIRQTAEAAFFGRIQGRLC